MPLQPRNRRESSWALTPGALLFWRTHGILLVRPVPHDVSHLSCLALSLPFDADWARSNRLRRTREWQWPTRASGTVVRMEVTVILLPWQLVRLCCWLQLHRPRQSPSSVI